MNDDIKDNEVRFLRYDPNNDPHATDRAKRSAECGEDDTHRMPAYATAHPRKRLRPWLWGLLAAIVLLLIAGIVLALCLTHSTEDTPVASAFEPTPQQTQLPHPLRSWLIDSDTCTARGALRKDTMVNDIPLTILLPIHCTPRLEIGYSCLCDTAKWVACFQAADIRADNKKIVGAFVLRGNPVSWGLSKRGYCAIIDGIPYVGVSDNSPLFEQATETGGDFFRQYPLVDNGRLVENELKNKSLRRALCQMDGHTLVVMTGTTESLHDFAQALVDIGAENAIYLTGSTSIGWFADTNGVGHPIGDQWLNKIYKNISFIIWQ